VPFSPVSVLHDGELLTTPDPGIEVKDRVKFLISSGGETLGSLCAVARDKRLGGDDRTTLELLSKELALLVKTLFLSEETRRLANNDGLTGLQNRRRTTERLEVEVARARRYGTPLALALCDVDHFKQVNDRFGHNMGDEVLRRAARRCRRRCARSTWSAAGAARSSWCCCPTPTWRARRSWASACARGSKRCRLSKAAPSA
jgi:hypothetical protein